MVILHWLFSHAVALAFVGGLLELKALLVLGGWAAQQADVPLAVILLFGFHGCALGEPLLISLDGKRAHASVGVGLRCARRLGITWRLLRPAMRPWSLTIVGLSGALVLSTTCVFAGYASASVIPLMGIDLNGHEAAVVSVLALVELLMRLRDVRQRRRRRQRDDPLP